MSHEKQQLKRTRQCAKCPWKKSTNPRDIPNGYDEKKHEHLRGTIANDVSRHRLEPTIRVMACHESPVGDEAHCIGWLMNQLGPGNNIMLRLLMTKYDLSDVQLDGPQHKCFDDTLPKK
jgi:hypothetical protein